MSQHPPSLSIKALPPLPAVASRLLSALDNEKISLSEISRLIHLDLAFTTEVLRLANSPVFPIRFEVVNVLHAVSVLGLAQVRALVLTVALRDFLMSLPADGLVQRCWRHNLATAMASETMAAAQWMDKSLGYTAGLMHDAGRLALISLNPGRYTEALEQALETGSPLSDMERKLFGADAAQTSRTLMDRWALPKSLTGVTCRQSGCGSAHRGTIAEIVEAGCEVALGLGLGIHREAASFPAAGIEEQVRDLSDSVLLRLNMFECEFMQRAA